MAIAAITAVSVAATASAIIGTFGAVAIAIGIGAGALMAYAMSQLDDMSVDTMSTRNTTSKMTHAPRKVVYGKCRAGGVIAYENAGSDFANTEGDSAYLHQYIALCEGECEEISQVFFDDILCAEMHSDGDFRYKNKYKKSQGTDLHGKQVQLIDKLGTDNQTAIQGTVSDGSDMLGAVPSEWTTSHRLKGVCYIYAQMKHDPDVYEGRVPKITAVVKGKKVYNPTYDQTESDWQVGNNTGSNKNDPSTWAWTDNPVLCLLDYMMSESYGLGESLDSFNAASAKEALAYCDEVQTLADDSTEKRFTCNGIVTSENAHRKNIENILSSMNGQLLYSNGQYHIKAYKYTAPVTEVIDEDILIGDFDVVTKTSRRDLYNVVKGKFVSQEHDYIMTDYPQQKSGLKDANYPIIGNEYEYDDGETLPLEYDLPMTTSNTMAQRLAYLLLLRSRFQTNVKFSTNMKGLLYTVGDNVKITNTALGYSQKIFQITKLSIAPSPTKGISVQIEAQDNAQAIYNWQASTAQTFTGKGTMAVGGVITPPTNLRVRPRLGEITAQSTFGFDVSFTKSLDPRIAYYRLGYRHLNDVDVQFLNIGLGNITTIPDRENGEVYYIEIKGVTSSGTTSTKISGFFDFTLPENLNPIFTTITQNDLSVPTDAELEVVLGRPPFSGDRFNVLQVDASGAPIDSITYVFEPEMTLDYLDTSSYATSADSTDDAYLTVQAIYKEQGVSPTWTHSTVDDNSFGKNYGDTTQFEGITQSVAVGNGWSVATFEIRHTYAEHGSSTTATSQHGHLRITATLGGASVSKDIYIFTQVGS